jgi:hypothetical protein
VGPTHSPLLTLSLFPTTILLRTPPPFSSPACCRRSHSPRWPPTCCLAEDSHSAASGRRGRRGPGREGPRLIDGEELTTRMERCEAGWLGVPEDHQNLQCHVIPSTGQGSKYVCLWWASDLDERYAIFRYRILRIQKYNDHIDFRCQV